MKKMFSFLLLMAAVVVMPTVLTSCGDDEPEIPENPEPPGNMDPVEDEFEDLYGYWINSDYSGAMEIVEDNADRCEVRYFVYTSKGIKTNESYYRGGDDFFGALTPDGEYTVAVEVLSSSFNKLVLEDASGQAKHLSSYIFSRVSESKFYDYLDGKNSENSGGDDEQDDDAKKLIGTWVGYDGTPGLESTVKFTLTFYSDGRATERVNDSFTNVGTYKYSNGKITEFIDEEGSVLAQGIGDCPWAVLFNSPTSMTIVTSDYYEMSFTKQ